MLVRGNVIIDIRQCRATGADVAALATADRRQSTPTMKRR
jgi:hypothetical protein